MGEMETKSEEDQQGWFGLAYQVRYRDMIMA